MEQLRYHCTNIGMIVKQPALWVFSQELVPAPP